MLQKNIYKRDISIDIDGVVKATDMREEILVEELKEYVLTKELMSSNMLPELFSQMQHKNFDKNIWISGHFGSGKSHLLKMLSVVLANEALLGENPADILASKVDASSDFEFADSVRKTCAIPTETILFNIQSKNDGIIFDTVDPILGVFAKVFNRHLGYSDDFKIANFERNLDSRGNYEAFKELYNDKTGKQWEIDGRKTFYLLKQKVADIYAEVEGFAGGSTKANIDEFINNTSLSIDEFAEIVKEYLDKKPKDSRLVFCVDEVGQFIADDVSKMLSLQTIVETLASKTNSKALVIVTSQNDLNATIGDISAQHKNDFSKITGRFPFKFALTSASADEVIEKRLLAKTTEGEAAIAPLYERYSGLFSTIINIEGDSPFKKGYVDKSHFVNIYPFTSYQFILLQACIKALNDYNAFTGGNQALGERSMLSVCQKVVKEYAGKEVGELVSFSAMYSGIASMLQSTVISSINEAAQTLDDFTVEVLKTLFLTKYEKRIQTTANNLATLMLPSFDTDKKAFTDKIQESLNLLEQRVFVQRSASGVYDYLTNQEKDVEQEIKNIDIDISVIRTHLSNILFSEAYNQPKVKVGTGNYNVFAYAKKCDEALIGIGRNEDIALHFVTPLCVADLVRKNPNQFSMNNSSDLVVFMPEDKMLYDDILFYEQTKKYTSTSSSQTDDIKGLIISDKRIKNEERKRVIVERVKNLLSESALYIVGGEVSLSRSKNITDRVAEGMEQLVNCVFTNLKMLKSSYDESLIKTVLKSAQTSISDFAAGEVEYEIISKLTYDKNAHQNSTIRLVLNHFSRRPYGWYNNAVLYVIALLYKRGKLTFKRNGISLADVEIENSLFKSNLYDTTIIELEEEISTVQIQKFKSFYQDYLGYPCVVAEPREISKLFVEGLKNYAQELRLLYNRHREYPFLTVLEAPIDKIAKLAEKTHPYFLTHLSEYEDELLDDKEDLLDEICSFMKGPQYDILRKIGEAIHSNSNNLNYLTGGSYQRLQEIFSSKTPYRGGLMQEGNQVLTALHSEIKGLQEKERAEAIAIIDELQGNLTADYGFQRLSEERQKELVSGFDLAKTKVQSSRFIAGIRDSANEIKNAYYPSCYNKIAKWEELERQKLIVDVKEVDHNSADDDKIKTKVISRQVKSKDRIKVSFDKTFLETEEDLEAYIVSLRKEYLQVIEENKRILL